MHGELSDLQTDSNLLETKKALLIERFNNWSSVKGVCDGHDRQQARPSNKKALLVCEICKRLMPLADQKRRYL